MLNCITCGFADNRIEGRDGWHTREKVAKMPIKIERYVPGSYKLCIYIQEIYN